MINKLTATVLALCFCSLAGAGTIPLHSYYIPGLIDSPTQGRLVEMLNHIERDSGLDFELILMPTKRVQLNFSQGEILGYFPELEENRTTKSCRTSAFMQKNIITVTRKDGPQFDSLKALEGKRVGVVRGYSYGLNIINNPNITLLPADNDQTNLKKLLANRLDVIVGDIHSTVHAIKATGNEANVVYDINQPIDKLDVFFLFQPTQQGQQLCDQISQSIGKLRQQGALRKWFGDQ